MEQYFFLKLKYLIRIIIYVVFIIVFIVARYY